MDREILHAMQKIAAELHEIRKALTQAQEEQPPEKEEDYAVRLQELYQGSKMVYSITDACIGRYLYHAFFSKT